jgi:hypothetical protein
LICCHLASGIAAALFDLFLLFELENSFFTFWPPFASAAFAETVCHHTSGLFDFCLC